MNFDLHCHSTASDGTLSPSALAERAAANGVTTWALTDHDVLGGLEEARSAAHEHGMQFVDGVEVSVTWSWQTVHIVGLGVDPNNEILKAGLLTVRSSRRRRAERIAAQLESAGIPGTLEGAYQFAEDPDLISRTHFARHLAATGHATDVKAVFDRFLVSGKPGYVAHRWAELQDAVGWIREAGGVPVVAHPGRYKYSREQLMELLRAFRAAGGAGIEVVTGSHSPEQYHDFAYVARSLGLLASRGSDFHGPTESKIDLGALPALPDHLTPIWSALPALPAFQ